MTRLRLFVFLWYLIGQLLSVAYGYELSTHGVMTYNAYERSVLKDAQFLKEFGIDTLINLNPSEPFGAAYYDISGNTVIERQRNAFEGNIIQRLGAAPLSLEAWLMRGAIREDDYASAFGEWRARPILQMTPISPRRSGAS